MVNKLNRRRRYQVLSVPFLNFQVFQEGLSLDRVLACLLGFSTSPTGSVYPEPARAGSADEPMGSSRSSFTPELQPEFVGRHKISLVLKAREVLKQREQNDGFGTG